MYFNLISPPFYRIAVTFNFLISEKNCHIYFMQNLLNTTESLIHLNSRHTTVHDLLVRIREFNGIHGHVIYGPTSVTTAFFLCFFVSERLSLCVFQVLVGLLTPTSLGIFLNINSFQMKC